KAGSASDRALILSRPKKPTPSLPAANMAGVTEPYWWTLRTFIVSKWNECPATPPPAFSTHTAAGLYKETHLGWQTGKNLTRAQRTTALYWADNPAETGTPSGHWLAIASQMVSEKNLSAEEGAKLMMLTGITLHDAFVSAWGYKFTLNLLRPRPYIRE